MPKLYNNREIFAQVCERIAKGESVRSICTDPDMPVMSTIFKWLAEDEDGSFSEQYVRAKEMQADLLFEQCLEIADSTEADTAEIQLARLRVDTRKWMAGKLRPKKYGDRSQVAVTGEDDGPIKTAIEVSIVRPQ